MEDKGDPSSRQFFDECVKEIVGNNGGNVDRLEYETNGRWARMKFEWPDVDAKTRIVNLLQGEDVVDVHSLDDINKLGQ